MLGLRLSAALQYPGPLVSMRLDSGGFQPLMPANSLAIFSVAGLVALFLVVRELSLRVRHRYEYRYQTFAVRGPGGRQLLHIRQSEISSLRPIGLMERLKGFGTFKEMSRSSFGRKVLIRSNITRATPVIVSWDGRAIAGLTPEGFESRPEEDGRKG
jgi:hypothetical protein